MHNQLCFNFKMNANSVNSYMCDVCVVFRRCPLIPLKQDSSGSLKDIVCQVKVSLHDNNSLLVRNSATSRTFTQYEYIDYE